MYRDGDLFFVVLFQIPMPFGNLAKRALGDACIKSFLMTKKKINKEETVIVLITAWVVKCALIQCAKRRSIIVVTFHSRNHGKSITVHADPHHACK